MTIADRVKLPLTFDVDAMQKDVHGLPLHDFLHYSVLPLTAPSPKRDPETGKRIQVTDYADGSWAEWRDTSHLASSPYLTSMVETFREHTAVTLVRLLRLEAGGVLDEHTDPTLGLEQENSVIRLTVPIFTNDGARFFLNDTLVPWQPGECWYLRFTDPHRAVNEGTTERIHMSIDMIPNEWVRSLILDAAAEAGAS